MTVSSIQLPTALANRLKKQLGKDFEQFQTSLNTAAPISIRLNPGKPYEQYASAENIPWAEQGKYLESRPRFTDDPLFHAGTYYVQEASSMFLAHVVANVIDLNQNHRVLDLSSAPGGKATHLQSMLTKDSLLVANEIIGSRNKTLRQNLARWGGDNHIVTQSDPKYFNKLPDFFDLILVDAPCSGEGLMRKDHAAIKEWSADNVAMCSRRQKRILGDIVPSLANDGVLIYSTCTFSEAENEANMEWLKNDSGLIPLPIDVPASWGIIRSDPDNASYRFYPHLTRGEGFFISAFKKGDDKTSRESHRPRSSHTKYPELANQEDQKWLHSPDRYAFVSRDEHRIAIPKSIYDDYLTVGRALRITYSGIYLGKVYHGILKPSPELALSQALAKNIQQIELSADDALDYLAHINKTHGADYPPGYNLVSHKGYGLGWMHALKTGQIRNKYPAAWRILQRYAKK